MSANSNQSLLAGVPVGARRLMLAGASTHVLEGGDGPPVVLLHGPGAYAAHWVRVIPGLVRSGYRVIAPDLPGHGASRPLEPRRVLAWLEELVASTCAAPPALVGQHLGGAIAARFAIARGARIRRLVLVDTFGLRRFEPAPDFGAALGAFLADPREETHTALWRYCARDLGALQRDMGASWAPFAAENIARARDPVGSAAVRALLEEAGAPAIAPEELARIAVPATLVWGRHDLATPLAVAEAASARHGWPLRIIEDAADDPPVEQPAAVLAVLRDVLDVEVAGLDGGLVPVAPAELRARVAAPVLRAGDEGWDEAIRIWNALAATAPALVVQPGDARAVAAAVDVARDRRLLLTVKGGGHNLAGTAVAERALTLDLSRMREVVVEPAARVAHVGGGCRLGDVDRAAQAHGLATPLGFVSEVGVGGLTLGGGLGYLTRRFGWTVDNLEAVDIVTADGAIRRASQRENPDLFWAVRGGGGNFGVVTRFSFRMHRVGPTVFGGLIAWPFERAREVLRAYRRLTASAPRELAVWLILFRAPPAPFVPEAWRGRRVCAMSVCHSGDPRRAEEALAPIRALGDPVFDLLREQPYVEVQAQLDGAEPKGNHYYWRTELAAQLDDALLDRLQELAAGCPVPQGWIGVLHLDGRLNELADDDGAVGSRDARYALGAIGIWEPHEPEGEAFQRWVREAGARLRPFSTGRTYVNFQTADEGEERVRASYGASYARLAALKRRFDPANLFRVNRNVAPSGG
jgi:pimeloyl-ACP methyl ester carboxylesterase